MPDFSALSHQFAMMIMPVFSDTKLSRNGTVVLASRGAHRRVGVAVLDQALIRRERFLGGVRIEPGLAIRTNELTAIGGEERGKGVDYAGGPRIDQPEALLAFGFVGERLRVYSEFVPGLGRRLDARRVEQLLVGPEIG